MGGRALLVTLEASMHSERIGQIGPGRKLEVIKAEAFDLGLGIQLVRACVALDDQERIADLRELRSFGAMPTPPT